MGRFVRASALHGFAEVAREAGADPLALCEAVGLSPRALSDPDLRIRSDMIGALLDLSARRTGLDDFALRMASRNKPSTWGAVGLLLMQQRTVGDAFQAAADFIAVHSDTASATIEAYGDEVVIWIELDRAPDGIGYDRSQSNELTVGSPIFVFRWLMKREWWPLQVGLTHSGRGALDRYKRYFGAIPLFDQDRLHFVCRQSDLAIELDDFDPEAERVARCIAEERLPVGKDRFSQAVALSIRQKLGEGALRAEAVAEALNLDVRTMQRRLAAENSSFSALLDLTRRDLAKTFVEGSRRPLTDVAELLGFRSLSAFSQWYGKTHLRSAVEMRAERRAPSNHGPADLA